MTVTTGGVVSDTGTEGEVTDPPPPPPLLPPPPPLSPLLLLLFPLSPLLLTLPPTGREESPLFSANAKFGSIIPIAKVFILFITEATELFGEGLSFAESATLVFLSTPSLERITAAPLLLAKF